MGNQTLFDVMMGQENIQDKDKNTVVVPFQQKAVKKNVVLYRLPKIGVGKDIHPIFAQLISHKTPYGNEKDLHPIFLTLAKKKGYNYSVDPMDNLVIIVPGDDETMFSCHLDTVHRDTGYNKLVLTTSNKPDEADLLRAITLDGKDFATLGGDDKAGAFTMWKMLEAGIPGHYYFHVGEERGCIGSKAIAKNAPETVKKFKRAIAFDRRDFTNIITKQGGGRCCSDKFAKALAKQLNVNMPPKGKFAPDDTGLYTDTASYMHLIPECTNLSIGYQNNHGAEETLDIIWLNDIFIPAVLQVKWNELPTEREAKLPDYYGDGGYVYRSGGHFNRNNSSSLVELKVSEVTDETPYYKLPRIDFYKDKLPAGISTEVMAKLLHKSLANCGWADKYVTSFANHYLEVRQASDHFDKLLQDTIDMETIIGELVFKLTEAGLDIPESARTLMEKLVAEDNDAAKVEAKNSGLTKYTLCEDGRITVQYEDKEIDTVIFSKAGKRLKPRQIANLAAGTKLYVLNNGKHTHVFTIMKQGALAKTEAYV